MERLTERFAGKYIAIKGCGTVYKDAERKRAPAANAIVRLAAHEDAMTIERAHELAKAEKDGRLVVLEPAAKEGEQKPPCFYNDMGQVYALDLHGESMTTSLLTNARSVGIANRPEKKPKQR